MPLMKWHVNRSIMSLEFQYMQEVVCIQAWFDNVADLTLMGNKL